MPATTLELEWLHQLLQVISVIYVWINWVFKTHSWGLIRFNYFVIYAPISPHY